jgi:hypothetical protein
VKLLGGPERRFHTRCIGILASRDVMTRFTTVARTVNKTLNKPFYYLPVFTSSTFVYDGTHSLTPTMQTMLLANANMAISIKRKACNNMINQLMIIALFLA